MSHELPYLAWLSQLKVGDPVRVFIGSQAKEVQTVTSAPKTFVTIGKYGKAMRFNRKDGIVCGKRPLKNLFRIEPP